MQVPAHNSVDEKVYKEVWNNLTNSLRQAILNSFTSIISDYGSHLGLFSVFQQNVSWDIFEYLDRLVSL